MNQIVSNQTLDEVVYYIMKMENASLPYISDKFELNKDQADFIKYKLVFDGVCECRKFNFQGDVFRVTEFGKHFMLNGGYRQKEKDRIRSRNFRQVVSISTITIASLAIISFLLKYVLRCG